MRPTRLAGCHPIPRPPTSRPRPASCRPSAGRPAAAWCPRTGSGRRIRARARPPPGTPRPRTARPARSPAPRSRDDAAHDAPARKRRGLLPRKRARTDAATPEAPAAPAAGDAPAAAAAPADAAPARTRRGTRGGRSRRAAPDAPPVSTGEEILDPKGRPATPSALRRERKAIIERRQAAVYHLGGLAFELYRRDMLGEDVMRLRARRLAEMDERVRRIDEVLGDRVRSRRPAGRPRPRGRRGAAWPVGRRSRRARGSAPTAARDCCPPSSRRTTTARPARSSAERPHERGDRPRRGPRGRGPTGLVAVGSHAAPPGRGRGGRAPLRLLRGGARGGSDLLPGVRCADTHRAAHPARPRRGADRRGTRGARHRRRGARLRGRG